MWCIWLVDGHKWIQSTKTYVEENDALMAAQKVKEIFNLDRVYIQFSDDPIQEVS